MNRRRFVGAIGALAAASVAALADEPRYIGTATMAPDGTITLWLRAEAPGGVVGHGTLVYSPGDPQYQEIIGHVGGLRRGETKPVPAWPDEPEQKK